LNIPAPMEPVALAPPAVVSPQEATVSELVIEPVAVQAPELIKLESAAEVKLAPVIETKRPMAEQPKVAESKNSSKGQTAVPEKQSGNSARFKCSKCACNDKKFRNRSAALALKNLEFNLLNVLDKENPGQWKPRPQESQKKFLETAICGMCLATKFKDQKKSKTTKSATESAPLKLPTKDQITASIENKTSGSKMSDAAGQPQWILVPRELMGTLSGQVLSSNSEKSTQSGSGGTTPTSGQSSKSS
jgi:hypothetical protein